MWYKIKSWFESTYPLELTLEREDEIINNLAQIISQRNLELPANLFLEPFKPISTIVNETALVWVSPILDFLGMPGYEYSLLLRKKENVSRLLQRIEELKTGKD